MKKSLALITAALAAMLVLTACGSSNSGSSSKSSSSKTEKVEKSSSSKESSSSKTETAKVDRAGYDAIKIGDLMKQGEGGDTLEALKTKFGAPASSTTSTTNGVKTDIMGWTNVDGLAGATMSVSFVSDKAVSKAISKLNADRPKDITLATYNGINAGAKYEDVNKQIGEPNGLTETNVAGQTTVVAVYLNKDITSFASLSFTNGALTTKTQSNLK
jgi:hypothetical protein